MSDERLCVYVVGEDELHRALATACPRNGGGVTSTSRCPQAIDAA